MRGWEQEEEEEEEDETLERTKDIDRWIDDIRMSIWVKIKEKRKDTLIQLFAFFVSNSLSRSLANRSSKHKWLTIGLIGKKRVSHVCYYLKIQDVIENEFLLFIDVKMKSQKKKRNVFYCLLNAHWIERLIEKKMYKIHYFNFTCIQLDYSFSMYVSLD